MRKITIIAILIAIAVVPLMTCFQGIGNGQISFGIKIWVAVYYFVLWVMWNKVLTFQVKEKVKSLFTNFFKAIE